jgi:hypothetical protein
MAIKEIVLEGVNKSNDPTQNPLWNVNIHGKDRHFTKWPF